MYNTFKFKFMEIIKSKWVLLRIYIFYMVCLQNSFAQIVEPLEFSEDLAIWQRYTISSFTSQRQPVDLRSWDKPIIKNGYMYANYSLFDTPIWPGFLIEKVDLATGEQVWKYEKYGYDINRRYAACAPWLDENDDYNFLFFKEYDSDPNSFLLRWGGALGDMRLDGETGVLLDSFSSNIRSTSVPFIYFLPFTRSFSFREDFFQKVGNDYNLFDVRFNGNTETRKVVRLDSLCRRMDSTVVSRNIGFPFGKFISARNANNQLFTFLTTQDLLGGNTNSKYLLIESTPLGSFVRQSLIDPFPRGTRTTIFSNINDHGIQLVTFETDLAIGIPGKVYVSNLNFDGVIQESIVFDSLDANDILGCVTKDGRQIIISSSANLGENKTWLDLRSTNGKGDIVFEKRIFARSPNQTLQIRDVFLTENEDVLVNVNITYRNGVGPGNNHTEKVWMLLPGSLFDSGTSVAEVAEVGSIELYPNPSQNRVFLKSSKEFDEVIVTDLYGRRVKSWTNTSELDISNIEAGIYFVKVLMSGSLVAPSKPLIKVR